MVPHRRKEPPSEAEAARHPDAIAGQALLEERLRRLSPDDRTAFEEAVRRCFASAAPEEAEGRTAQERPGAAGRASR
ncbi:hypothetical protein U8607_13765 [Methylobacterium durans]|uniref:hypothetical protein n=1 Tax=Methylobacterium durans TaxID=2202825 RepID=UPI002AFFA070|nr:hypothetical protein [Methylobacterium durans]MEA1833149.1 hypothetical protein [Methylobacterium durans]